MFLLVIGKATCIQLKPKGSEPFKVEVAVDKGGRINLKFWIVLELVLEKNFFALLCSITPIVLGILL